MNKVFIYGLLHPDTRELRYVGKTVNLKLRLQSHIDYARSKKKQRPVSDWINSLAKKPIIEVLEETNELQWVRREMYWIKFHKQGGSLLNLTDGGESNTGYIYSNELKEVRRKARLNWQFPNDVKNAIAKSLSKEVICVDTGIIYQSMKEATSASGVPKSTFHRKLHKRESINGNTYQFIHSKKRKQ